MKQTLHRIPLILLGIISVALATATVIDKEYGLATACRDIYLSPWMIALWVLTAVSSLIILLGKRTSLRLPGVLLHFALALILLGAGVTHFWGVTGRLTIPADGTAVTAFTGDDGTTLPLPFSIALATHGVSYHAGTAAANDYHSTLIIDGNGAAPVTVSMNRPLDIHGYRFCQSAMSGDSTTLSVNHDPAGISITYSAYLLLFLSMAWLLIDPRGKFRALVRSLAPAAVLPLLLLVGAPAVRAADTATTPRVLQRALAASFGRLYIYDGDRVEPLSTYARNFCLKVYGSTRYRGLSPEQVVTGWMFYYDDWKDEPMIRLKSDIARRAIGVDGRYATLMQMGRDGVYLLEAPMDEHPDNRTLGADNDRVSAVTRLVTGQALQLLPRRLDDGYVDWQGLDRLSSPHLDLIAREIAAERFNHANDLVKQLREYQITQAGTDNLPSEFRFEAERLYNRTYYPLPLAIVVLTTGLVLMFVSRRRYVMLCLTVTIAALLYLLYLTVMRWIIGNHIPIATGFETMQALAIMAIVATLLLWRRYPVLAAPGIVTAGAALMVASFGANDPAIGPLIPVLSSPLLSIHVMLIMAAYSLLAMITGNSLVALCRRNEPSRTRLSMMLLYPAEMLLAAGIFVGAVWANESWGRYWGWDPKETWALITMFIYALPFHRRLTDTLTRPRTLNLYLVIAFAAVLMTYLGVNYLLAGLHSYGTA